jgi:ring-1,2-phenylacetyl-CoA epoxidase subunit PaaE
MLYQPVTIKSITEAVSGFKIFVFEDGHGIHCQAGQYLTFIHPREGDELRRSYSILSAPLLHEPLAIGVRRIDNGAFSRWLTDHAMPGSQLLTTGAAGFFTLPGDLQPYQQVFFFAAGSGITPIYSLLKTILYLHPQLHVVLIYSNSSPEHTILYQELIQLRELFHHRFRLQFIFSNARNLRHAHLNRERLVEILEEHLTTTPRQALFYTCGPEAYMRMCTYTLQEEKVPTQNIRREHFTSVKKTIAVTPPDRATQAVSIMYGGEEYSFTVAYPDSILQAAKKEGIRLPYSCEAGRCGNCAARLLKGNVWLSYNEVLTEKELEEGLTLTCVGHPVGGDVALSIDALKQ